MTACGSASLTAIVPHFRRTLRSLRRLKLPEDANQGPTNMFRREYEPSLIAPGFGHKKTLVIPDPVPGGEGWRTYLLKRPQARSVTYAGCPCQPLWTELKVTGRPDAARRNTRLLYEC